MAKCELLSRITTLFDYTVRRETHHIAFAIPIPIRTQTICDMEPEYEDDGLRGISYEIDEDSFPYGFFKDVDYSETLVTVGTAKVKKNNGRKNGGGIISVEPGSTLKKEKKEKKTTPGSLRGNKGGNAHGGRQLVAPFGRK